MTLILLLLSIFSFKPAQVEDSWKVTMNGKVLLKASAVDPEEHLIKISMAELKKKKDLTINYTEGTKKDKWERTITVYDEKDKELNKQKGNKFKMSSTVLQSLLKKSGKLKIYTWSLPTDPKLKQAVRVRRIHLVTLVNSE